MSDDIPEVNAQRRRKTSNAPSGQAQKPSRQGAPSRPSSGGGIGMSPGPASSSGSSGSGYSGGSGNLGGLGGLLGGLAAGSAMGGRQRKGGCGSVIGFVVVLLVLLLVMQMCSGNNSLFSSLDSDDALVSQAEQPSDSQALSPTSTRWPTALPQSNSGKTWLVMLYQDADDEALEQDILMDFNEAEMIGSTDQVIIVSQLDRHRGGYSGDGNWSTTRRYLVTYDDDLNKIGSELIADLGELNMGSAETLVDFVSWAASSYPADNHILIMSDHGMGWPGGWSDPAPSQRDNSSNAPLRSAFQDDILYLNEIEAALKEIQRTTAIDKFELIGLDACLMSQMEVYSALAPYTKYAVASEETEPGVGWAYSAFLSLLVYNPDISTAELATNIVETYITQDQRVVDDRARAEFLNQNAVGAWSVNRMNASQLAQYLGQNITITAVDLQNYQGLLDAVNQFAYQLQGIDQKALAKARNYSQSYTSIFGSNVPPSFIDLGHFVQLVYKDNRDSKVRKAAEDVIGALNEVIVAEKHGPGKPGSTGIAIYFPNSQLYSNSATGMASYTVIADSFSKYSLWDDFLAYHYSGRQFQANAAEVVKVERASQIPGLGTISVSALETSAQTVDTFGTIDLSTIISGENIGYIYLFTGMLDEASNSIWVADMDYLESSETAELNGVYYPVWPQANQFKLNFTFEPVVFTIRDGTQEVLALFNPQSYGKDYRDATYAVDGIYTFKDSGESHTAQLLFKDERLYKVLIFVGGDELGAPYEVSPNVGDSFSPSRRWMDLDSSGNVSGTSYDQNDSFSFSGNLVSLGSQFLPSADYLIGILVSDMDGNVTPVYTQISVE